MALTLTLATATPGGGFPVYGDAVIAAVREVDPALTIEPRNTKGSTENVPLLEKNEVDLALVQGEVAYEALQGVGRAPSPIRIVAAMYSTPGMFVVRADSPARTIEDLKGRPVAFGESQWARASRRMAASTDRSMAATLAHGSRHQRWLGSGHSAGHFLSGP